MAKMNGTGRTGKTFNDRVLAADVRTLTLHQIKKVLETPKMSEFKKAVILRLSGSILPRLNENSGPDGQAERIEINVNYKN